MDVNVTKANVSTVSKKQQRMIKKARLARTLMGGTQAMREAKKEFLPQEPKESDKLYENRVARSVLYNMFSKAVGALTGKLFAEPIVLNGVPSELKNILEDVEGQNGAGMDFNRFLSMVVNDGMAVGLCHILVDMPALPKNEDGTERILTVAEAKKTGHRPRWFQYNLESVVSYRVGVDGKLDQLVLKENVIEPEGDFGEKEVTQYRVLKRGSWAIWRKLDQSTPDGEQYTIYDQGTTTLDFIPWVTIYCAKKIGFMEVESPLLDDLSHLNCTHWQSSSDQRNILHVARVPILFATGWEESQEGEKEQEVGANTLIKQGTDATLEYVEHTGASIESGEKDLQHLEDQMAIAAMEPLVPKTGNQTATAKAIETAEATSALQDIAQGLKDSVEQLLVVTGAYLNIGPEQAGEVVVNADFKMNLGDVATLGALYNARSLGDISREAYLANLQKFKVLDSDYNAEEDKLLIDQETATDIQETVTRAKALQSVAPTPPAKDQGGTQ